ncbi:asparaginase [Candidatus Gottesmanbacteria bacterium]|nr:asparaginase [Candidatus Gottesmanbacteria bacterium]
MQILTHIKRLNQSSDAIFEIVPDWKSFFLAHQADFLRCYFGAKGGSLDSIKGKKGLKPIDHPLTIEKTTGFTGLQIYDLFRSLRKPAENLGVLYKSTSDKTEIPWLKVSMNGIDRISSFGSGQEVASHFLATLHFIYEKLQEIDTVYISQGTDTLSNTASLCAVVLSQFLIKRGKKIVFIGSPESIYENNSLAIPNITAGLYVGIQTEIPGGVYVISSFRDNDSVFSNVLPAFDTVKFHADGYFYSSNADPLLTIYGKEIYQHQNLTKFKKNLIKKTNFPDLSIQYLINDTDKSQLENVLNLVKIETVSNDEDSLEKSYKSGKRVFVIRARGVGNGPIEWKNTIKKLVKKGDTTVLIITLADSGDVDLTKYQEGLDINGVFNGRTLREEAAVNIAAIIHDLHFNVEFSRKRLQQFIETYCYYSGILVGAKK